jgi:hypothetical protein
MPKGQSVPESNSFPITKPTSLTKERFVKFLKRALSDGEVSWITTDKRTYDWADINLNRKAFLKKLSQAHFTRAFVGVFYSKEKRTDYLSFEVQ